MTREIKFRIWNKISKRFEGLKAMDDDIYLRIKDGIVGTYPLYSDDSPYFSEEDEEKIIVTQFTGLKDKNGKEIYEGDIVKINPDNLRKFLVKDIRIDTLTLSKMKLARRQNKDLTPIEVIGNKFENPELLK